MAIKTYRALQKGVAPNGAIVEAGEEFSGEFRVIEREDVKNLKGEVVSRRAKRDDDGSVKTVPIKEAPSWCEEIKSEPKKASPSKGTED